jgi:hypothetical protein
MQTDNPDVPEGSDMSLNDPRPQEPLPTESGDSPPPQATAGARRR